VAEGLFSQTGCSIHPCALFLSQKLSKFATELYAFATAKTILGASSDSLYLKTYNLTT
jgi:hypothetical protein